MNTGDVLFYLKKNAIIPILAALFVASSIMARGFLTVSNIVNIVLQSSVIGVMCVGATFLIINGYRDLSVGMVMGLVANLTVGLQPVCGLWSALIGLLAAAVIGLVNAFLVTKAGLDTFIATMATMLGTRSLIYIYTQEKALFVTVPEFAAFGRGTFLSVPYLVWIFIVLLIVGELVLRFTVHGRNTFAAGGNKEAAHNAGINVTRTTTINFVICALGGALGGIMTAARMNSAIPELGFSGNEHFMVIVMVALGGTKMSGGYGNMLFTFGGVLTVGVIQNILNHLNVNVYYATMTTGLMLIVVLILDKAIKPAFQKK